MNTVRTQELTGGGKVQIIPAGAQDSGIDSWDHVGLIHDIIHHIMITVQLTLKKMHKRHFKG